MNVRLIYVSADHKGMIAFGKSLGKFYAQPVQNRTDGRSKKEPHDGEEKNPVPIKQNMGIP